MVLKNVPMLSFYRLIMSGKTGLGAIEKKVIDRTVQMIYQSYFADYSQRMWRFWTTWWTLCCPSTFRRLTGWSGYRTCMWTDCWNSSTTVTMDISNSLVCFDIKSLDKNLKKSGFLLSRMWCGAPSLWTAPLDASHGISWTSSAFRWKKNRLCSTALRSGSGFGSRGGIPAEATQNPKDLIFSRRSKIS